MQARLQEKQRLQEAARRWKPPVKSKRLEQRQPTEDSNPHKLSRFLFLQREQQRAEMTATHAGAAQGGAVVAGDRSVFQENKGEFQILQLSLIPTLCVLSLQRERQRGKMAGAAEGGAAVAGSVFQKNQRRIPNPISFSYTKP
jgi:hypothetical protein